MRKLLLLPVTLPLAAAQGAARAAFDAVVSALGGDEPDARPVAPPAPPAPPKPSPPRPPAPEVVDAQPAAPPEPPAVPEELEELEEIEELAEIADELGFVDAHVEEPEPELVESEGAADPGPALRVEEPWKGYGKLRAPDIVDRLAAADAATKAVVRLYESTHRGRRSVLAATED